MRGAWWRGTTSGPLCPARAVRTLPVTGKRGQRACVTCPRAGSHALLGKPAGKVRLCPLQGNLGVGRKPPCPPPPAPHSLVDSDMRCGVRAPGSRGAGGKGWGHCGVRGEQRSSCPSVWTGRDRETLSHTALCVRTPGSTGLYTFWSVLRRRSGGWEGNYCSSVRWLPYFTGRPLLSWSVMPPRPRQALSPRECAP